MKLATSLCESLRNPKFLNIASGKPGDKPGPGIR